MLPDESFESFWACNHCPAITRGGPEEAHQHHLEKEGWSHWLYEFSYPTGWYPFEPTGREIHTSDMGGYYLSTDSSPESVWESFARKLINEALRQPISAT